jgi:hypothetical protein
MNFFFKNFSYTLQLQAPAQVQVAPFLALNLRDRLANASLSSRANEVSITSGESGTSE